MVPLSHSLEDYIEAIYLISLKKRAVRVKEVSKLLDVKTPSVVDAVSKLQEKELIKHEKYGYLYLTEPGLKAARQIYRKHEGVYKFLNQFLGMDKEVSEKDACGIEHYISRETLEKIIQLMRFIESDPSGYPDWIKRFNDFAKTQKK